MINDTICAISTAVLDAGINIIRISGEDAISIVNSLFKGKDLNKVKSHTIHYGFIIDLNNKVIDEVLVSVFRSPKTFTKENIVEVNCHGGVYVTQKILDLLIQNGCRLALKGEFTKRAYINGRIDLLKAEAIMDIIQAENDLSLELAQNKLFGHTSDLIINFRRRLLELIAQLNVTIDYPEYDDETLVTNEMIYPKILPLKEEILKILENAKKGNLIKNGIKTLIIGKPNAGKSSILNMLLQEEKAIVTNIPGTTRDVVEGCIHLKGIKLNLLDTAGIRKTNDIVEKIGVEKSLSLIEKADLILIVIDNANVDEEDLALLEKTKQCKRIILLNKSDLKSERNQMLSHLDDNILLVSTYQKDKSIKAIENKILDVIDLNNIMENESLIFLTNVRHISKLELALKAIDDSIKAIEFGDPLEFIELDLKNAYNALGEITGDTYRDSLLDEMFSKFCLGK